MSGGPSTEVYRIDWIPGTDMLHGVCHCGAEHRAPDPVVMWEWMLGHPEGHATSADRDEYPKTDAENEHGDATADAGHGADTDADIDAHR